MANRLLGGQLPKRLADLRGAGLTFEQIARIFHESGVDITAETLRVWAKKLGIEGEAA